MSKAIQQLISFSHDLRRRNSRTQSDLAVLAHLSTDLKEFNKLINPQLVVSTEKEHYKDKVFAALKNIGRTIAELSMRDGDLCDGNSRIPWTELTAMASYFHRFQQEKEFHRLDQAQIAAIGIDLEQLSEMLPDFTEKLNFMLFQQSLILNDIETLLRLIDSYRVYSSALESLFLNLHYIPYDLSHELFLELHDHKVKKQYIESKSFYEQIQKQHLEIQRCYDKKELPDYLKIFLFEEKHQEIFNEFDSAMQALLQKYNDKSRARLIKSARKVICLIHDDFLARDANLSQAEFVNCKFSKDPGSDVMPGVRTLMQQVLDHDNVQLVIDAINNLGKMLSTEPKHFRAAVLYVLVMIGETCKAFSQATKALLPKELLSELASLRDSIIHGIDNFGGRIYIEELLEHGYGDLFLKLLAELQRVKFIFENLANPQVVWEYDLAIFSHLKEQLHQAPPAPGLFFMDGSEKDLSVANSLYFYIREDNAGEPRVFYKIKSSKGIIDAEIRKNVDLNNDVFDRLVRSIKEKAFRYIDEDGKNSILMTASRKGHITFEPWESRAKQLEFTSQALAHVQNNFDEELLAINHVVNVYACSFYVLS